MGLLNRFFDFCILFSLVIPLLLRSAIASAMLSTSDGGYSINMGLYNSSGDHQKFYIGN
jgi:hypothetical protein